ncbi:hypothetical protein [Ornithinimicrobium ciconiae]|uniref:hypothetical protein n=1 Tax=Ornithinimicrobium ciconiae TaxID=2594265 RepID=UPI0013FCFD34|nr:hypothetical protein [Ornithinimicrobium ciconiae]
MSEQDLLARADRMLETARSVRQTDPSAAVSLSASVVVMAHVAVLHAHGQQPIPADERRLGAEVTELLGGSLVPADRLTELLDVRDGLGTVNPDEALADAGRAVERARGAIEAQSSC